MQSQECSNKPRCLALSSTSRLLKGPAHGEEGRFVYLLFRRVRSSGDNAVIHSFTPWVLSEQSRPAHALSLFAASFAVAHWDSRHPSGADGKWGCRVYLFPDWARLLERTSLCQRLAWIWNSLPACIVHTFKIHLSVSSLSWVILWGCLLGVLSSLCQLELPFTFINTDKEVTEPLKTAVGLFTRLWTGNIASRVEWGTCSRWQMLRSSSSCHCPLPCARLCALLSTASTVTESAEACWQRAAGTARPVSLIHWVKVLKALELQEQAKDASDYQLK